MGNIREDILTDIWLMLVTPSEEVKERGCWEGAHPLLWVVLGLGRGWLVGLESTGCARPGKCQDRGEATRQLWGHLGSFSIRLPRVTRSPSRKRPKDHGGVSRS